MLKHPCCLSCSLYRVSYCLHIVQDVASFNFTEMVIVALSRTDTFQCAAIDNQVELHAFPRSGGEGVVVMGKESWQI